jgi:hypothetical protein
MVLLRIRDGSSSCCAKVPLVCQTRNKIWWARMRTLAREPPSTASHGGGKNGCSRCVDRRWRKRLPHHQMPRRARIDEFALPVAIIGTQSRSPPSHKAAAGQETTFVRRSFSVGGRHGGLNHKEHEAFFVACFARNPSLCSSCPLW